MQEALNLKFVLSNTIKQERADRDKLEVTPLVEVLKEGLHLLVVLAELEGLVYRRRNRVVDVVETL